ncbi:Cytochrome b5-related protein [Folsomia candida]|uniref:Cytochrome b5-related protein n=2 Tax=Folsomia candida TaxID=158441 RepID=A0A226E0C0_FOLCA|nr:Cytochrome b5-related protein [Folsomia candida]
MAPNLSGKIAQNDEEPPSSFPGIWKTPSGRETPFRSGYNWMESKRLDDDIGNLWRVHDKLYDLTPFIHKHPGGPDWLELTQGTDITEAFETSHIVNVDLVEKNLAKFYVQDATKPRISPYTFKENGFFKTLKKKIAPIMTTVGTGPTNQVILMQDGMVAMFLGCMLLGTWLDSTVLKIISGFFLAVQLIGAHNFFHLKDNWRKYYFDLGLLSSHEWKITHSLSHHLYPNTLMDIELELFPTYQFLPNRPKNFILRWYGPVIYSHLLYIVGFWMELGRRIFKIAMGEQKLRVENGIVFLQLVPLVMIAPTVQAGIWSWIFIHSVASFTFLTQGANAAHHHPDE